MGFPPIHAIVGKVTKILGTNTGALVAVEERKGEAKEAIQEIRSEQRKAILQHFGARPKDCYCFEDDEEISGQAKEEGFLIPPPGRNQYVRLASIPKHVWQSKAGIYTKIFPVLIIFACTLGSIFLAVFLMHAVLAWIIGAAMLGLVGSMLLGGGIGLILHERLRNNRREEINKLLNFEQVVGENIFFPAEEKRHNSQPSHELLVETAMEKFSEINRTLIEKWREDSESPILTLPVSSLFLSILQEKLKTEDPKKVLEDLSTIQSKQRTSAEIILAIIDYLPLPKQTESSSYAIFAKYLGKSTDELQKENPATLKAEIRKKFTQWHPDKNPDDKALQAQYTELYEAYAREFDPKLQSPP